MSDYSEIPDCVSALMKAEAYAFDTETTGLEVRSDVIIGAAFTVKIKKDQYRSWYFKPSPEMPIEKLFKHFEPVFLDIQKLAILHNAKFDLQMLKRHNIKLHNKLCCTKVMAWIINENRIGHLTLKDEGGLVHELFNIILPSYKESSLSGSLFGKEEEAYACLNKNAVVLMSDGTRKTIKYLVDNKVTDCVRSYDANTGIIVDKPIIGWHKTRGKVGQEWLRLRLTNEPYRGTVFTPEHEVYTQNGWNPVSSLKAGDLVCYDAPKFSEKESEFLLATALGDGTFPTRNGRLYGLVISHSEKQKEYLDLKAEFLKSHLSINRKIKNAAGNSSAMYAANFHYSMSFNDFVTKHLYNGWRSEKNTFDRLGAFGFAIWYMDDGVLAGGHECRIISHSLGFTGNDAVVERLSELGIKATIGFDKRKGDFGYYIRIPSEGSKKFCNYIGSYIPECLRYKLVSGSPAFDKRLWDSEATSNPVFATVHSVEKYIPIHRGTIRERYCLSVQDTQCFFTKDGLAHNCDDTLYTYKVYDELLPQLKKQKLEKLFWELEMQILPVVVDMELRGMFIDVPTLYALEKTLLEKYDAIAEEFYVKAGRKINIGSPEQLSAFFFDELGWKPKFGMERSKKGLYPTGEAILSKYAENDHEELAQLVLDYRGVLKLLQTYVRPLTQLAMKESDSRIHSTINQTGTVTGRFCVAADTEVVCSHGVFPITQVKVGDFVLTHEGRFRKVLNVIYKGMERMWVVRTSMDHMIRCTMNHRFLTPDGWKSLREIHFNDQVKVMEEAELVYDTLSWFMPGEVEDVWDLEVEEDHSYVGNGFVNHNSSSAPNLQNCFDDKTEILTDSGWKLFKDLDKTESVMAYGKTDRMFQWEKPTAYVCRPFSGDLVSIQGAAVDLVMTKEHNCLLIDQYGYQKDIAAESYPISKDYIQIATDFEDDIIGETFISTASLEKRNVSYSGNVYCVTVPSGYIVVRRNGKASLTGNCPREKGTIKAAFKSPPGKTIIVADECVAEGTKIATSIGVQTIESVIQGTQVVQEDGSYRTVLRVANSGVKPCLLMTTKCGYSLAATKDHKIRVMNKHGDYVWKLFGQVSSDDFVAISSNWLMGGSSPLPDIQFTHGNNKGISIPGLTTTEFARFCGFITGNGTMPEGCRYVGWVVCDKDKDVDAELSSFFTKVFARNFSTNAYRGVIEHKVSSTPLVSWLKSLGVAKDRIPEFVWTGGPSIAGAWLSGLFDSDGCCTLGLDGRVSFCSSRQSLVYDVQDLLLGLGIPSSSRKQKQTEFYTDGKPHYKDGKVHFAWHLSVNSTGLQSFKDKVGFKAVRKSARLDELIQSKTKVNPKSGGLPNQQERVKILTKEGILTGEPRRLLNNTSVRNTPITPVVLSKVKELSGGSLFRHDLIENGVIFLPVVSVEDIGMKNTYDLEIEDTHTFISNGFVTHNSQLELRIMAHLSQDPTMLEIYRTGGDIHKATQDAIGCKERSVSKATNFGLIYGMGSQTFQANLWRTARIALSIAECQKFDRAFFAKYPAIKDYHDKVDQFLRKHKYVQTLTGRRRHLGDAMKANYGSALRQAINFTVQGLGADIVKIAMRNFQRELIKKRVDNELWEEVFMVMQVHDEIVIEAPLEIAQEASDLLKHCMETAVTLSIPLIAEPKIAGSNGSWEDCK